MNNDRRILIRAGDEFVFGEPLGSLINNPDETDDGGIIQWVTLTDSTGTGLTSVLTDGSTALITGLNTNSFGRLFNGSTWDRERSNTEETFLASALRTATVNSADFTNWNAKGLHVIIDVSVISASPSIVTFVQGKDPVSGNYYDILEGLPITTTGINIIKVFPGISAIVNASASDILPRTYRVRVEHANTDSITYSVGGALVV